MGCCELIGNLKFSVSPLLPEQFNAPRVMLFGKLWGLVRLAVIVLSIIVLASPIQAKETPSERNNLAQAAIGPNSLPYVLTTHKINQMQLVVSNAGFLGKLLHPSQEELDAFTGEVIRSGLIYPRGSRRGYLGYIDIWIGAESRTAFRTSVGVNYWASRSLNEMLPAEPPGKIVKRSAVGFFGDADSAAISEEDIFCSYMDSLGLEQSGGLYTAEVNDQALGVQVRQSTNGWSMSYAEDFIIVEWVVRNVGDKALNGVHIGIHIATATQLAAPLAQCAAPAGVIGYHRSLPSAIGCGHRDALGLMWASSPNGYPYQSSWLDSRQDWILTPSGCYWVSTRGVLGVIPLTETGFGTTANFNWWSFVKGEGTVEDFYFEPTTSSGVPSDLPPVLWTLS